MRLNPGIRLRRRRLYRLCVGMCGNRSRCSHQQLSSSVSIAQPRHSPTKVIVINSLSERTRFYRLMTPLKFLPPHLLDRLMDIDYDRRMAFVASAVPEGCERFVGLARYGETDRPDTVELGITAVPTYVFDGRWSVPGAQDPDTFLRVLERVAELEAAGTEPS